MAALCDDCEQDIAVAESCTRTALSLDGIMRQRVRYGDGHIDAPIAASGVRCPDCGVLPRGIHHAGCCKETCPACGAQLFCCECYKDEGGYAEDYDYALMTASPDETRGVGRLLGRLCRGGEVILLEGQLGAGKTTLVQGLAEGLDIAAAVVSPTFILLREYEGRLPLYHFDFYRLEESDRAVDLEFDDYLNAGGVCVIEWPAYAPALAPPEYLHIALALCDEENVREVQLTAVGARHKALRDALVDNLAQVGDGEHLPSRPNPVDCRHRNEP